MGLGIGLGSFTDGFARGYGIRADMDERKLSREDRERRIAREDEQFQWQREDRAFDKGQRDRQVDTQEAIDAINDDARQKFDEGVKKGELEANEFDEFWTSYALPKMKQELLLSGDVKTAAALEEWGTSEAAKKGGRLFTTALLRAQTGDYGGALDAAVEASKVQGYLDHGYEIGDKEEIKDTSGKTVGYRIVLKDGEGNEIQQDIALDDIPMTISTFANPAAAWESQRAAAAKAGEREQEMTDYERKKGIDAKYSDGDSKRRSAAIKTLREQSENMLDSDAVPFDDLSEADQEAAIDKELGLQSGSRPAPMPSGQVVVDGSTGAKVTGLGGVPQPTASGAPGLGAVPQSPAIVAQTPDPALAMPTQAQVVKSAADMMVQGKDPNEIALMLRQTGVDPSQWPAGLTNATNPGGTARTAPAK